MKAQHVLPTDYCFDSLSSQDLLYQPDESNQNILCQDSMTLLTFMCDIKGDHSTYSFLVHRIFLDSGCPQDVRELGLHILHNKTMSNMITTSTLWI
jgi:hypothetical protein